MTFVRSARRVAIAGASLTALMAVAAWLVWALYQRERFTGLQAGIALLHALCTQHWDALHPRKVRTRGAALGWLLTRLEPVLSDCAPTSEQLPLFQQLIEHLKALDACLSTHLGEEAPLLLPLCRRVDDQVKRAGQTATPTTASNAPSVAPTLASSSSNVPTGPIENDSFRSPGAASSRLYDRPSSPTAL